DELLRHAAVRDDEEDVLALRRELVGHLGVAAAVALLAPVPGVREEAVGLEAREGAFEGALAAPLVALGDFAAGELRVVELQADLAAEAQVELARGEPARALVRLGDVAPDALDGAGQQALEPHGAGLDGGDGTGHFFLLGGWGWEGLRAFSIASSARNAASRASRR